MQLWWSMIHTREIEADEGAEVVLDSWDQW